MTETYARAVRKASGIYGSATNTQSIAKASGVSGEHLRLLTKKVQDLHREAAAILVEAIEHEATEARMRLGRDARHSR